jgi:hypothetical protein
MPPAGGGYAAAEEDSLPSPSNDGPPAAGEWIVIPRDVAARTNEGAPVPLPRYVSRTACEWVPASVALDNCAFPLEFDEKRSTMLLADDADEETVRRIEFILNRRLTIARAPRERVARLIEVAYGLKLGERDVAACGRNFRARCTRRWSDLLPTPDEAVRFCGDCSRPVYYCRDDEELRLRGAAGQCAAVDLYLIEPREEFMGLLEMVDEERSDPPAPTLPPPSAG